MRAALWLGAVAALLFAAISVWLQPLQPGVLALQLSFTPRAFAQVVHSWSADDLARFRAHLPLDALFALVYGAFGHRLFTVLRTGRLGAWARWLLPLAALLDLLENALHAWLTAAPRFDLPALYLAGGVCAALKWALVLGFGAALAWALGRSRAA